MIKYIDAEQLAKDLERLCDIVCRYSKKQRDVMCRSCPLGDAFELLDNQPAADVAEVRHGRWILGGEIGWPKWTCTVCGGDGRGDYKLCPWCGASMDLEGDAE